MAEDFSNLFHHRISILVISPNFHLLIYTKLVAKQTSSQNTGLQNCEQAVREKSFQPSVSALSQEWEQEKGVNIKWLPSICQVLDRPHNWLEGRKVSLSNRWKHICQAPCSVCVTSFPITLSHIIKFLMAARLCFLLSQLFREQVPVMKKHMLKNKMQKK